MPTYTEQKFRKFKESYFRLLTRKNLEDKSHYNGIFQRYLYPVITAEHIPLEWRYDLNPQTNPWLMERIGVSHYEFGSHQVERKISYGGPRRRKRP